MLPYHGIIYIAIGNLANLAVLSSTRTVGGFLTRLPTAVGTCEALHTWQACIGPPPLLVPSTARRQLTAG